MRVAVVVLLLGACTGSTLDDSAADAGIVSVDAGAIEGDAPDPPNEHDAGDEPNVDLPSPVCTPGQRRWCNDAIWDAGSQTCLPDGSWGPCVEPRVDPHEGYDERPATECGCRFAYFRHQCCEDQEDRDGDGLADCLIPEDYEPPDCSSDGSLCAWCDSHEECGGPADLCVYLRNGYAFCSRDCTTEACPDGYSCQRIGTSAGEAHQCVPDRGHCGDGFIEDAS